VQLVKDSWNVCISRVNTNKKAVLNTGSGPRVLNKNVLLFPETLDMKPSSTKEDTKMSDELSSSLPPNELNISHGLEANLVECIVIESNRESHLQCSNIIEIRKKHHETAKKDMENNEK
jgi:hypothetical protein